MYVTEKGGGVLGRGWWKESKREKKRKKQMYQQTGQEMYVLFLVTVGGNNVGTFNYKGVFLFFCFET